MMSLQIRSRRFRIAALTLILLTFVLLSFTAGGLSARTRPLDGERLTVGDIESLGVVTFETGFEFAGTEVGGLSGIAFDSRRDVYYVVADDRDDPRYYTVDIDLGTDGRLDDGDVTFVDVTFLRDRGNVPFPPGFVDAESIDLLRHSSLFISSEGDVGAGIDPFVNRFNLAGKLAGRLPVPDKFLLGGSNQINDNLAFEGLAITPNQRFLYTATENALAEDGPIATLTDSSPSRLLEYNLSRRRPDREFVYIVSPIPVDSDPPGEFADNGMSELESLDNHGTFLAMERSFAVGVGNTVRLFETSIEGATDVSEFEVLPPSGQYEPMSKMLVADFESDLGIDPDNLEAMRFGPTLADGRQLLIVVSDNNFNPTQITQFIALAVELEPVADD